MKTSGFGRDLRLLSLYRDVTPIDLLNFKDSFIIAFDAIKFAPDEMAVEGKSVKLSEQYYQKNTFREITKVRAAILPWPMESKAISLKIFATGNWGCGMSLGDVMYKSLLQWVAASSVGRTIVYYAYGNEKLIQLPPLIVRLKSSAITTGQLLTWLLQYQDEKHTGVDVFQFINVLLEKSLSAN